MSDETDNFYDSEEYQQLMQDNPVQEQVEGPTEEDVLPYLDGTEGLGVKDSLLANLRSAWTTGGKIVDNVADFARKNPGLTSMLTSGVGTAMGNKQRTEDLKMQNQFKIDAETRAKADAKELWDRRNQSIIDTQPASLGILGSTMYDNHLAYLKNRKKA